jgi:hypothetical protein
MLWVLHRPDVIFRHDLIDPRLVSWNILLHQLATININTGCPDEFRCNLHHSGKFSIHSMYKDLLEHEELVDNNRKIWKMKIPLKTEVCFAWYLRRSIILTKYNLTKHKWNANKNSVLCYHDESIKHFFPIQFCHLYMVSHRDSFYLISTTQHCKYFLAIG